MKIQELLEARRNKDVNNQRGYKEVLNYLRSLDFETLSRTYVHLSMINKAGMTPSHTSMGTGDSFEPLGIYCYESEFYIEYKGDIPFARHLPYIHVITLKKGNNIYNGDLEELKDTMKDMYPDIDTFGDKRGRSKTTLFLIKNGYDVMFTNQLPGEYLILNPRAVDKVQTFVTEHIPRGHQAYRDAEGNSLFWRGPGSELRFDWWHPSKMQQHLQTLINNQTILNHDDEYKLLFLSPKTHNEYVEKVLNPQKKSSTLSYSDIKSIEKKQAALNKRGPYTPSEKDFQPDNVDDFKNLGRVYDDHRYNLPSHQVAPKLYLYASKSGKQLTKIQEKNIVEKGLFDDVNYALAYYRLLHKRGQKPLLSYHEMFRLVNAYYIPNEGPYYNPYAVNTDFNNPHQFVQSVKDIFNTPN